jgi:hypothetical protein
MTCCESNYLSPSQQKALSKALKMKFNDNSNPFEIPNENQIYIEGQINDNKHSKSKTKKRLPSNKKNQKCHRSLNSVTTLSSSTISTNLSSIQKKSVSFIRPFVEVIEIESYKKFNSDISKRGIPRTDIRKKPEEKIACSCNVF